MTEKTVPYNEDAEIATLGALMIDPEAGPRIFGNLSPEEFYFQKHRFIYKAMQELYREEQPFSDYLLLAEQLERKQELEYVGGMAFLASLSLSVPSALNIDHYAELIRTAAQKRKALQLASDIAKLAYDDSLNGTFGLKLQALATDLATLLPESEAAPLAETAIPPLPELRLETSTSGAWLDTYVTYAQHVSPMTPARFHLSAALWLASSIIARRLYVPMDFARIYPNLWFVWVARSTIFGKSTSMDLARRMAVKTVPHLLTPEDMTPEGLILDMSGAEPSNLLQMRMDDQQAWTERRNFSAQRAWTMDEFSGLLASTGKDYNAGLLEILLKFYDCTERYDRLTASRGLQCIHNAYLTLLAASTPTAMAQHLTSERLWGVGWWPRLAILVPETERPEWALPSDPGSDTPITGPLRQLYERLPRPRWPDPLTDLPVSIEPAAFELWSAYNKALRYELLLSDLVDHLWASYGRLPVQTLKVATVIAALEWGDTPTPRIQLPHLHRAISITEDWRACLHHALALADAEGADKLKQAVIQQISKVDPLGVTARDIYKALKGRKPAEIERALTELQRQGDIVGIDAQNPRGGPRTTRFVLSRG